MLGNALCVILGRYTLLALWFWVFVFYNKGIILPNFGGKIPNVLQTVFPVQVISGTPVKR